MLSSGAAGTKGTLLRMAIEPALPRRAQARREAPRPVRERNRLGPRDEREPGPLLDDVDDGAARRVLAKAPQVAAREVAVADAGGKERGDGARRERDQAEAEEPRSHRRTRSRMRKGPTKSTCT